MVMANVMIAAYRPTRGPNLLAWSTGQWHCSPSSNEIIVVIIILRVVRADNLD